MLCRSGRGSGRILGSSVEEYDQYLETKLIEQEPREEHTPQKKWRIKIINTLLVTFGPVYSVLKGTTFPS